MLTMGLLYSSLRICSDYSMLMPFIPVSLLLQQTAQLLDAHYLLDGTPDTSAHEADDGPL